MVSEMEFGILDGQSSHLFPNEPFQKRAVMTIEDLNLYSDDHFDFHLFGVALCQTQQIVMIFV